MNAIVDDQEPLPVQVPAVRRCLGCSKPFQSHGAGNRFCRNCRKRETWQAGITEMEASF